MIPDDRRGRQPQAFTAAELTVLLGLVCRARVQAERRREKRQHLQRDRPGSPGPTKADRLERLFAKLEALRVPGESGHA